MVASSLLPFLVSLDTNVMSYIVLSEIVYNAVLAQDFATHGMYTEPNTGMTFYASYQTNSATPGGMLDGNSQGGFLEGVALPPNAATVDATEFIGIIVRYSSHHKHDLTNTCLGRLHSNRNWQGMGWCHPRHRRFHGFQLGWND